MNISTSHIILYVSDQGKSKEFYETLFGFSPRLNVPGMTEFDLNNNCVLGLMPESGIAKIITPALPHPSGGNGIPRCEVYLYVDNIELEYKRILELQVKIVSPLESRDWGDKVFYLADNDGHVIAFAEKN